MTQDLHLQDLTGRHFACNLASPSSDLTLPHIVVHMHSQRCLSCGVTHRWTEVYECQTKGRAKILLPARRAPDFPLDYTILPVQMPCDPVMICHLCVGQSGVTDSDAHTRWAQTLARKRLEEAGATSSVERASPAKVIPSLDQL